MPYQLPPDPSTARRARVTEWVTFLFAALLVALVAYFGYVGYEGSRQFTEAPAPSADCRTPATLVTPRWRATRSATVAPASAPARHRG